MAITHAKVSAKADGADASEILASDWNNDHVNADLGLPLALTGAVAATRFVGGHATVAPTTGTFAAGDYVITLTGKIFICTTPGSPGTWVQADAAAHVADTSAAHTAASVSADSTTLVGVGTDVQAVLEEMDDAIVARTSLSANAASTQAFGDSATNGSGTAAAKDDHKHAMPADPFLAGRKLFATFSKQGVVAVTTEGDTPPPHRVYNDSGRTLTFHTIRATATTAPAGAAMTIDLNVDGTTIMSGTKVVIADGGNTVTQTTFSTATIADGHYLSMNVDGVGSGTAGSNLTVAVWVTG